VIRVHVGCQFDFAADVPVPMLMLVEPRPDGAHSVLRATRSVEPAVPVRVYRDLFGNACWRFVSPIGPYAARYDALVDVSSQPDPVPLDQPLVPVAELPDETLAFTLPTRYIQSDLLIEAAWDLFGSTPLTGARVQAVCDWVHANIDYRTGSSDLSVTAFDTFHRRYGVCRDLALLTVGFCRALNIPARYACGYLPDIGVPDPGTPMDFHAWTNIFIDGDWYVFDSRHNVPRIGRVEIGQGRDVVDVALSTSFGNSTLNRMTVWSTQVPDDQTDLPRWEDSVIQPLAS
jgi:transglutaminase-like putative cysteine protease